MIMNFPQKYSENAVCQLSFISVKYQYKNAIVGKLTWHKYLQGTNHDVQNYSHGKQATEENDSILNILLMSQMLRVHSVRFKRRSSASSYDL